MPWRTGDMPVKLREEDAPRLRNDARPPSNWALSVSSFFTSARLLPSPSTAAAVSIISSRLVASRTSPPSPEPLPSSKLLLPSHATLPSWSLGSGRSSVSSTPDRIGASLGTRSAWARTIMLPPGDLLIASPLLPYLAGKVSLLYNLSQGLAAGVAAVPSSLPTRLKNPTPKNRAGQT